MVARRVVAARQEGRLPHRMRGETSPRRPPSSVVGSCSCARGPCGRTRQAPSHHRLRTRSRLRGPADGSFERQPSRPHRLQARLREQAALRKLRVPKPAPQRRRRPKEPREDLRRQPRARGPSAPAASRPAAEAAAPLASKPPTQECPRTAAAATFPPAGDACRLQSHRAAHARSGSTAGYAEPWVRLRSLGIDRWRNGAEAHLRWRSIRFLRIAPTLVGKRLLLLSGPRALGASRLVARLTGHSRAGRGPTALSRRRESVRSPALLLRRRTAHCSWVFCSEDGLPLLFAS